MMNLIHWYLSDLKDVPGDSDWLSQKEKQILENLRFLKRRQEWRLGRWAAKTAVKLFNHSNQNPSDLEIEILVKNTGAPLLLINGKETSLSISISHREQKAVCVLSETATSIGCDLEFIEPRSDEFINDYFTDNEKNHLVQNDNAIKDLISNIIWSAKESVSKVLEVGLNMDTRDVNVSDIEINQSPDWKNFNVTVKKVTPYSGKWIQLENYIMTIASNENFYTPKQL